MRRRAYWWLGPGVWLVCCLLLAACTSNGPGEPTPDPDSTTASSATPTASSDPSPGWDGRPVQPTPDVSPPGFADPPPGKGAERYRQQPVNWAPCRDGLECAQVLAPLDRSEPDGQALTLSLARRPATEPRQGAIFVNPGGPGGSGVTLVESFPDDGLENYDIIGWDPRGTGESTPVQCWSDASIEEYFRADVSPDDEAELQELITLNREYGASCLAASGPLLSHISTEDTVADLELLRGLVDAAELNYVGYSYGTEIGARYADTYPDRAGRLVLVSPVTLAETPEVTQVEGFDRALGNFADWCVAQDCALGQTADSVVQSITDLFDALDENPIRAGDRLLTQSEGVAGVQFGLYSDSRVWDDLAGAIAAARAGDGQGLLLAADRYHDRRPDGTYGPLLTSFDAVRCLDHAGVDVPTEIEEAEERAEKAPVFGTYSGLDLACSLWPVAADPPQGTVTGKGAPPILLVGSTGDSATPYEEAEALAEQLESAVLLTHDGDGHVAHGSNECVDSAVRSFLTAGRLPAPGARCS